MAENTKVEWATNSFNPWVGCTRISVGCDNCYAEQWSRFSGSVTWGSGEERRRTTDSNWKQPVKWNKKARDELLAWQIFREATPNLSDAELADANLEKPVRPRVFCASLSDVFDNEVPPEWRRDLFDLIKSTPYLDWLIVTKRIGNAKAMLPDDWGDGWPNVWLLATVCNQIEADRDIPKLLDTPAKVRGLSMEPLLNEVRLDWVFLGGRCFPGRDENSRFNYYLDALRGVSGFDHGCSIAEGPPDVTGLPKLDWVIVGGESGHSARPMNIEWVRSLRDQCHAAGTPFFFKQWGEWVPGSHEAAATGGSMKVHAWDAPLQRGVGLHVSVRVGKKEAGRVLDGVEWNEYPL
jgi:protein gp37